MLANSRTVVISMTALVCSEVDIGRPAAQPFKGVDVASGMEPGQKQSTVAEQRELFGNGVFFELAVTR